MHRFDKVAVINLHEELLKGDQLYTLPSLFAVTQADLPLDIKQTQAFHLFQNYPNPFNPETTIEYYLHKSGDVTLSLYDIKGNLIKRYVQGILNPGTHSVQWNGRNESGNRVASGIYFYRIEVKTEEKTFMDVKKMILLN
jgi:hypothetical protein